MLARLGWFIPAGEGCRRGGLDFEDLRTSIFFPQCPNDYLKRRGQRSRLSRVVILVKLLWGQRAAIEEKLEKLGYWKEFMIFPLVNYRKEAGGAPTLRTMVAAGV